MLKQAILRRGLPQRLYADNGAHYRSPHRVLVCAKLGIALIQARPYRPQGKAVQLVQPIQTYANCFVKRHRSSWTLTVEGPTPAPARGVLNMYKSIGWELGLPREVNRFAHYALTSAAIDEARTVTAEHVQAAHEEIAP